MTTGYIGQWEALTPLMNGLWSHFVGWSHARKSAIHAHRCTGCGHVFICTERRHAHYEADSCPWCTPWCLTWREIKAKPKPKAKRKTARRARRSRQPVA